MQKMSYVKRSIITAACVALCVILPMAFHSIQNAGSILSPMHIPVLLCGLICGPAFGLLSGLVGPLLSSLFTGMPPMAYLPPMIIELAVYGLVAGLMISLIRTKKLYVDLYLCLVIAMIAGRIVAGIAMALIFVPGSYSMAVW
ncbi:MAG TPA: ECF transporter S component, partial [Firmicutes bacterium]|nr:ECF transporter S component [Bacillota bacterium]HBG43599.1 ECF transporter S component [Bacillota bacterium]